MSDDTTYVAVTGLSDLGQEEFTLPQLKLVQAQDDMDGSEKHLGEFYNSGTGEFTANPNLLVLSVAKSRAMFLGQFSRDAEPACRSDNGKSPREPGTIVDDMAVPHLCADCDYSKWTESAEGKPIKPKCAESDNWAALTETGDPVILRLRGTSAPASGKLKNLARAAYVRNQPLWVRLASRYERKPQGNYYVVVVETPDAPPPARLVQMASGFTGLNLAERAVDAPQAINLLPSASKPDNDAEILSGEVPTPTSKATGKTLHWIDNAQVRKAFWAAARDMGYSDIQAHDALHVNHMREWAGTMENAIIALTPI